MTTPDRTVPCPQCKGNGRYTSKEAKGMGCDVCHGHDHVTAQEARAYDDRVDREIRAFNRDMRRRKT